MQKISLFAVTILFTSTLLFADYRITRGPAEGEIYYIGPTVTGQGIYRSTDFGQTATCMDSTLNTNILFMSIAADLTPGVVYGYSMPENLYISYNYGQQGSWIFRDTAHWDIHSGRNEGEIFDCLVKHSIDYGLNFISHSMNGFFGSGLITEIDNQDSIAYAVVSQYGIPDTLWSLITYDNYETLEIQTVYNRDEYPLKDLSRGIESGELFSFTNTPQTIYFSNDYGYTWETKNSFTCPNLPIIDIVGGRQPGEVYMLVEYVQLMSTIKHTYIYHSLDYGEIFTVYNPFSYGPEPYFANFIANPTEGEAPLTVQFTDISSGENNQEWQWDFDGDGEIDSTEQNPEFIYQVPGTFYASLTIFWSGQSEMTATREIIVTDSVSTKNYEIPITNYKLSNYPNPFNPSTEISFQISEFSNQNLEIQIFNSKGQKMKVLDCINRVDANARDSRSTFSITWDGTNSTGKSCPSGVYLYKLVSGEKELAANKMLLLK